MFINNFDPVAFEFFALEIRWYSLAYLFGLLLGWMYCKQILIKEPNTKVIFDDYISYIILGVILGGRLGYVILYNPVYFYENPNEILKIWNGGMSFHGGLIGIIFFTIFFCLKKKQSLFYFLDLVAVSAPIGIFFGRLANFINSELVGKVTDVFWSVKFIKIDNLKRHPSQLYEAIFEGIILFLILNYFYKKYQNNAGVVSSLFLIFYSLFRFFIEFVREPDPQLGLFLNFSMGQILSLISLFIGIVLLNIIKHEKK